MELANTPVPVPLLVLLPAMVGLGDVFQQTPLAVTADPPSLVTLPPAEAVVQVIALTTNVVTVGPEAQDMVAILISFPYAVPAQLTA
jgi:hypothetical protein